MTVGTEPSFGLFAMVSYSIASFVVGKGRASENSFSIWNKGSCVSGLANAGAVCVFLCDLHSLDPSQEKRRVWQLSTPDGKCTFFVPKTQVWEKAIFFKNMLKSMYRFSQILGTWHC